jgi:hypothetical protein
VKTFTESREFVTYLGYYQDREKAIAALDLDSTDEPIVDIVSAFADQQSKKIHFRK